jgi:hypothetical protein
VQCVSDFSGHELSLQFIDHTNYPAEEVYLMLETKVLRVSQQFYVEVMTLPFSRARKIMDQEMLLVSRTLLQRTVVRMQRLIVDAMMQSFQTHYFGMYKEYPLVQSEDGGNEPLMYTPFGKMIYTNDNTNTAVRKIRAFLDYMKAKNLTKDIMAYNDLVT